VNNIISPIGIGRYLLPNIGDQNISLIASHRCNTNNLLTLLPHIHYCHWR